MIFKFFPGEPVCRTCEVLADQLFQERTEKQHLLRKLMEIINNGQHQQKPEEQEVKQEVTFEPMVHNRVVIPSLRRKELEAQEQEWIRRQERIKRENEELEKKVGIAQDVPGILG